MRRALAIVAAFVLSAGLLPASVAAAEPVPDGVQIIGLEIVYVPPGVKVPEAPVGLDNVVYGNCGWASMWVNTSGTHRARFEADAGSSHGIMVRVDWTISWSNADTGAGGGWSGTTWQFSPTWGVDRETLTGPGTVYGTLTRLIATHWDGVVPADRKLYPASHAARLYPRPPGTTDSKWNDAKGPDLHAR